MLAQSVEHHPFKVAVPSSSLGHPNVKTKEIRTGWWAEIMPLTFSRARIIITDGRFVEIGW